MRRDNSAMVPAGQAVLLRNLTSKLRAAKGILRLVTSIPGEKIHVVIQKVFSSSSSEELPSNRGDFGSKGATSERTVFQAHFNNVLNNVTTELNNKQQQKERRIQRNRRGPGGVSPHEAGSELVGHRKAAPDGRSCGGEGSHNNSSGAAGDKEGVEMVED